MVKSVDSLPRSQDEIEKGKSAISSEDDDDSKLSLKDFCQLSLCIFEPFLHNINHFLLVTPQAKRAIFISFMALTLNFASGTVVILSYVTEIFTKSGSSLSTKNSSLLVSITQITANVIFLLIVERINRRVISNFYTYLRMNKSY